MPINDVEKYTGTLNASDANRVSKFKPEFEKFIITLLEKAKVNSKKEPFNIECPDCGLDIDVNTEDI